MIAVAENTSISTSRERLDYKERPPPYVNKNKSILRYYVGMLIASFFSLSYFWASFYLIASVYVIITTCLFPSTFTAGKLLFCLPFILSAVIKPVPIPLLIRQLQPLCDYFNYEEIIEMKPVDLWQEIFVNNKNYLFVLQPHGAISFGQICSGVTGRLPIAVENKFPSAVADALLLTPILKHVLGIFGIISASKRSIQRAIRLKGPEGCVIMHVGGIAEIFLCSDNEEMLYLKNRKGFIKLALEEGVDVVPIYLFGNTSVLSVMKTGILADLSRKFQVSLTYIWGRYFLPIPRDCKILYVCGQPLGITKIQHPTQSDIDRWHDKYCQEVTRLFETYKERVPEYKHKKLTII